MTSGLVLMYLNGDCLIMREGYESTLLASTQIHLTRPIGHHFQKYIYYAEY